jgi:hypothetical protein
MRISRLFAIVSAVAVILSPLGECFGQNPGAPGRPSWEYKVMDVFQLSELGGGKLESGLNKLGSDGWELVSVEPLVPRPSSVAAKDKDFDRPLYSLKPTTFFFRRQGK